MIVVFDTNAYRNIVSRTSKDEAVAKVVDIKHKEFEKGIIPFMSTTVAMELLSHLCDVKTSRNYQSCLKASQVMYLHCGDEKEFRLLPLPETQISYEYFNIINIHSFNTQQVVGQLLYLIAKNPTDETVDSKMSELQKIRNFIDTGEQTLANEIERFCRMTDPTFTDWTIFKNDAKNRSEFLKNVRSEKFYKITAEAYLTAVVQDLKNKGYAINSNIDETMIFKYVENYKASLQFRTWFFSQLVNGNFDLTKGSRTNFVWDELILHFIGQSCNNDPIMLVTSDGRMHDAVRGVYPNGLDTIIKTYEEYMDFLGL